MASHIPRAFITDLIARTDIVEVIDNRVPLKKAGMNYSACCPFHNEKTPSFTVSPNKQFYHCFGCGANGNVISFLMEYDRLGFVEAVETLAAERGIPVPRSEAYQANAPVQQNLYDLVKQASDYYQQQLQGSAKARDYLNNRGLSADIIKEFAIGYAPDNWDNMQRCFEKPASEDLLKVGLLIKNDKNHCYDKFRDRVMFPIRDRRGRYVGFGGRVLGDGTPKYLNSPETPIFHKGSELYGLYEANQQRQHFSEMVIVEGYMDLLTLAQYGFRNVVATLGTSTTKQHLERLYRHVDRVVFCFDGDNAGRQAAWRALQVCLPLMQDGRQANFIFLPDGEDPDTLLRQQGADAFKTLVKQAEPLSSFFFRHLREDVDIESLDGKARLASLAKPLLSQMPEGAFKTMLYEELSKFTRLDSAKLQQFEIPRKASPSRPQRASHDQRRRKTNVRPTPMRVAIALLLQHPQLAEKTHNITKLAPLSLPGMDIFVELVDLAQTNPHLTTAALLEHWRDREHGDYLFKLAAWEHMLPDAGVEGEYLDTLKHLEKMGQHHEIERLLAKANEGSLGDSEKALLQSLISHTKEEG
ncbi:MAG: DNA primase [Legionellales bacterium]|nr:DNA primase [Legionellales bacterium]|tara:strand:+ start:17128 stop:18879 length:1752 start_codon:yes stop_codon:yes gene_type:complete